MSTRIERLVNEVNDQVTLWNTSNTIKYAVGDSTFNNRVPSVRQTIRYLTAMGMFTDDLASDLERVYLVLRQKNLFRKLRRNGNRTDAYDINEFNTIFYKYVVKNSGLKISLGRLISSVN